MNKRNFVFNYVPKKRDFDDLQNDLEAGINNVAKAVAGRGILSGLNVSISSSTATVSPGVAYDVLGNRIEVKTAMPVDIGVITRPSAGKYKWATIALRYAVMDFGSIVDGNNRSWAEKLLDSVSAEILEGDEGTSSGAAKKALEDQDVPLLDIKVDRSSAWENLPTETTRRPPLIPIADASSELRTHKAERVTSSNTVHGIRQGAGGNLDADLLDGSHLSEVLTMIYPVGSSYIQFPSCPTPAAAGLPGTWEAQFENDGVFFRTPGNRASAFESGIQGDAMQRLTGWIRDVAHGKYIASTAEGVFVQHIGSSHGNAGGGGHTESFWFNSSRQARTAAETRPRNRTFRIWKRTA